MSNKLLFPLVFVFLLVIFAWNSLYIVLQTEKGILLRFGEIEQSNLEPGLHFKWPIINKVKLFDGRLLTLETPNVRFLTKEKKSVMVDAYARWRVSNPELFYTSVRGEKAIADERLGRRLDAALRNQFGNKTLNELVNDSGELTESTSKSASGRNEVMEQVTDSLNKMAQKELGIEVLDVRIKAIDLPKEVYDSVFARMRTEREREAQKYRAEGREAAERIRAEADRQKQVILAEAYRNAEEIRGEGDAEAATIYANAYSKAPEFYNFYRSLQAYRESFKDKNDVLVLDPNSDFFRYLQKVSE
ncbi:protease modulator HflC [Entomomonas asaccharolytica]|uniref:Protein HflC n=1 Tax=Entomomonas asaccharolytica TaxID=2785331 RepID=A0A974RYI6_9GAMM|nr:protease modulator HflC [Entomomonas asaccharolytica]QQP85909.1 protease modulator HflC [Entomomonas asaccharolytica]